MHPDMAEMTLAELARLVGGKLTGEGGASSSGKKIRGLAALESAGPQEASFLANAKYERHMAGTRAAAVIVAADYDGPGPALIRCKDPYFAFRQAMVAFYGFRQPHFDGIDKRANIDPAAKIAPGVKIAAFVTVALGCTIGEGTVLYPGVYVGPNCRIGRDCILYPSVTLYDGSILGDRVTIHAGASIGQDGFGYATHGGKHEKIPQIGWVELGNDVEIGACCAIDRATLGPTIIADGTKFSNLVAIGHGTKVGRYCLMVAQSGIAGSTTVGDYCVFGGQSGAEGHIKIGDGVQIAAQTGVVGDVPPGIQIGSSPSMPLAQARRAWIALSRLPQLRTIVQRLAREVAALKRRLGEGPPSREEDQA
jgi:UDP-3-O-[3-hydroxymyristoyl] glucosamine N-acyltransferase